MQRRGEVLDVGSSPLPQVYGEEGVPIAADTSQADGYPPFSATKDGDLNMIKVGTERYEIPDAAVLGG